MKNSFYIILCVFLLIASVKAEIYTSVDGYKFEVNLSLQKNSIMLGEPIYMDFDVTNLSEQDLGVLWGGDYRNEFGRPDSFKVEIVNSNGEIIPKLKTFTKGGGLIFRKTVVGENFNFRLYLPHWATIEKIGDYKISVKKKLVVKRYDLKNSNAFDSSNGIPVELTTQIKVVPSNYNKMGEVVDKIGKQLVEGEDTAQKLVPFIKDERIIKYLIAAVEKNHWLMRNLSKFDDDTALNAILSKINNSRDEVRRNVSISLSLSVHPKASNHLLQMRNDKTAAIRLDVVHFLGKTKTTESTRILKEMLNDEDKWVKDESKRYLTERSEN